MPEKRGANRTNAETYIGFVPPDKSRAGSRHPSAAGPDFTDATCDA